MALEQKFIFSEPVNTGDVLWLTDETGDYDATDNPGGYGAPNTARNEIAIFVITKYKATAGDTELQELPVDPETATQWQYNDIKGDGFYQADVYNVLKSVPSPNTNDFRYDSGNLERWDGSQWVPATKQDLETYGAPRTSWYYLMQAQTYIAFNYLNQLLITTPVIEADNLYRKYKAQTKEQIDGNLAVFCQGNRAQAQLNIENYANRITEIMSLSNNT